MKYQVISDLHLEFHYHKLDDEYFRKIIKPLAPILILAGDIGKIQIPNLKDFLKYVSNNWEVAFYVLGNHEFYNRSKSKEKLEHEYRLLLSEYSNIHMLQNESMIYNGVEFIGTTLWSRPTSKKGLNDFKQISSYTGTLNHRYPITPAIMSKWNQTAVDYLRKKLNGISSSKSQSIVITHFMPLMNKDISHSRYPDSDHDMYYGNQLYDLLSLTDTWISGHTHQVFDLQINDSRWISNAFGYPGELDNDLNTVFEI